MSVHCLISEQKLDYIREVVNQRDPKEDYKLIRSIGGGTYGKVYKALRLNTNYHAAVKIIKIDAKDDIKAVLQEIQTLRDCRHPNIVEFYDSYFRHNKLWICMEFCGGYSMQDIYINTRKPVDEDSIAFLSRETLRGITYMHSRGKIHRDIKGANILLCNDGAVKIADFGVVAQITQTIQRRNSLIGTPYWMAPEVVAVDRKGGYDEKCDIWAVGITALEYAELQPPMFDLNPLKALRLLSMKNYKPPTLRNKARWSNKFHGFLKFALTKNEKKRPTASLMLTHEFVTQPQLSQALTLRLLQQNRNPDPITFGQSSDTTGAASASGVQPQSVSQAVASPLIPESSHLAAKPSTPVHIPNTNGSAANDVASPKVSLVHHKDVHIKTPPNRFPFSSAGLEAASRYVATHQKEMGMTPVPKSKLTHAPSAVANGAPERILPTSVSANAYPRFPVRGKRLEDVCIMDELAAPLPAYAANTPTASPAPKPPSLSPTASAASFSSASGSPCSTISSTSSSSKSSTSSDNTDENDGVGEVDNDNEGNGVSSEEETPDLPKRSAPLEVIGAEDATSNQETTSQLTVFVSHADEDSNGGESQKGEVGTSITALMTATPGGGVDNDLLGRTLTLTNSVLATADLDLDVADEQLLAADGVLTLAKCSSNKNHTGGGEDRISEFGFRMQDDPSEEEEEEEEEEPDFDDINPEVGFISHPGAQPAGERSQKRPAALKQQSFAAETNGDRQASCRLEGDKSNPDAALRRKRRAPRRQVSDSTELGAFNAITTTFTQSEFFPEKTGAELAEMLRQLKFAQKFAWLAGESAATPVGLSSYNPASEPALHCIVESGAKPPLSVLPIMRSDVNESTCQPPLPQSLSINSVSTMSSDDPSVPFTISPVAHPPLAQFIGIESAADITEATETEKGFPTPAVNSDFSALVSNSNDTDDHQQPMTVPSASSTPREITTSLLHLSSNQSLEGPSTTSAISRPPLLPTPPLNDYTSSSVPRPPSLSSVDYVSKAFIQHQAFTSPCFPSQPLLHTNVPTTSFSLNDRQWQNIVKREKALANDFAGRCSGLRRIAEEQGRTKITLGAAPLADQETEEDDAGMEEEERKKEVQVSMAETESIKLVPNHALHSDLTHEFPDFCVAHSPATFSVPSSSSTCPNLPDRLRDVQPQRCWHSRKTASALFTTETPTVAAVGSTTGSLVESLKTVATEPVITKPTLVPTVQHRISPPTYLSPQPSKILRQLGRSVPDKSQVAPTSASSSRDHALLNFSLMGSSVSSGFCVSPWGRQSTTDLPPSPQVHMGACFTLVFEGCPLTINSTASWINPADNGQILLFGNAEGIYFLSLRDLANRSLELLSSRPCHWLKVVQNTMVSVSGNPPHLYTHNLITLMKMKASGHSMNAKLGRISNLFPKRFSPSHKVAKTKGCLRAGLVRSPFTGARYLCAAFPHEILVMEWVNTLSTFIETKRVPVLNMPKTLETFDLLVQQDSRFPLVCLGIYRHHSRRGLSGERYRLHLVDLNAPTSPTAASPAATPLPTEPAAFAVQAPSPLTETPAESVKPTKTRFEVTGLRAPPTSEASPSSVSKTAQDKNSLFLQSDRLPVVSVIQLLKNTVLVCFPDCAKLVGFNGRLRKKLRQPNTITFDGLQIQSIVGLRESLLAFHPNGFLGKSFSGELTQEINDEKHIYRVLGHDRHIVVESRPVSGSPNSSNIYLLAGHTESSS